MAGQLAAALLTAGLVDELAGVMTAAGFTVVDRGTRQDPGARRHGWIEAVGD